MGKFHQILTELSAQDTPIFLFPDKNLSEYQGISTKLSTCIDIKEIWFGNANGQISSIYDRIICPHHNNGGVLSFCLFILKGVDSSLQSAHKAHSVRGLLWRLLFNWEGKWKTSIELPPLKLLHLPLICFYRYHLGSVAFGSFIIAVVKLARLILAYIQKR